MTASFNLIDEVWIPCITVEGNFNEVSLRDLFARAPELREIACETAIQSAAILPLALAILHRNFGPATMAEWGRLWKAGAFDMQKLDSYFATWYERFDLFHPEKPFYQAKEDRVEPKPIIHLVHPMANSATLFSHDNEDVGIALSPAEAACQLLAASYFKIGGPGPWGTSHGPGFTHSIFSEGVIFWALGSTIFETLLLNLIQYPNERIMPKTEFDMPSWETNVIHAHRIITRAHRSYLDGNLSEKGKPEIKKMSETIPFGYLDYLTFPNNTIELIPVFDSDRVVVREYRAKPAFNLSSNVLCPQKRFTQKKKKGEFTGEYSYLYFNENKALWRDYDSLLRLDSQASKPPAVIDWLANLTGAGSLDEDYPIRLTATGMSVENMGKPVFSRREAMPLPLKLLRDPHYVLNIEAALAQAEKIEGCLRFALDILANAVLLRGAEGKPDPNDRRGLIRQWRAREHYWLALEPHFWRFIETLVKDSDEAIDAWIDTLKNTALESLRHADKLAGGGPWALKGAIHAERQLRIGMNKIFKE